MEYSVYTDRNKYTNNNKLMNSMARVYKQKSEIKLKIKTNFI